MNTLRRFLNWLRWLFTRPAANFSFDWGTPKGAQHALRTLFPDLRGDFQKPDGTKHPRPVRYIRHKRRAGSPYRRKRLAQPEVAT